MPILEYRILFIYYTYVFCRLKIWLKSTMGQNRLRDIGSFASKLKHQYRYNDLFVNTKKINNEFVIYNE